MISNMSQAFLHLISLGTLLSLLAGTVAGLIIGTLPGIGPAAGVGLLVPLAYFLPHLYALLFYVSLYQSAEYGGSITAISISLPGAPNSAAIVADGYAMNLKGFSRRAFGYSLWSVLTASYFVIVLVLLLGPAIAAVALGLGPAGYVMLGLFGLSTVGSLGGREPVKGLLSVVLGILLGTVGLDPITGVPRYVFGVLQLDNGIPLLPFLIGLFAIPQVCRLLYSSLEKQAPVLPGKGSNRVWLHGKEFREVLPFVGLGTGVGMVLGVIPGLAGVVGSFISYNLAKLISRRGRDFGNGVPEGIATPEATNGAVMHATLVPAFLLGIPGTPTSAIILGAMTIMGLSPGPTFISRQPVLFYSIFLGLGISAVFVFILGIVTTSIWMRVSRFDRRILGGVILILCVAGAFSSGGGVFDVAIMFAVGIGATLGEGYGFSVPAVIMGFLVGPIIESNLSRMLIISHGSFLPLINSPMGIILLALILAVLILGFVRIRSHRSMESV